jgi:hypothetical protein
VTVAVYVDDMRAPFGRMVMCHMLADTTDELLAMAVRIGVDPKWIQKAGTHREHFDVSLAKRALAVEAGAVEVTRGDVARLVWNRNPSRRRDYDDMVRAVEEKKP